MGARSEQQSPDAARDDAAIGAGVRAGPWLRLISPRTPPASAVELRNARATGAAALLLLLLFATLNLVLELSAPGFSTAPLHALAYVLLAAGFAVNRAGHQRVATLMIVSLFGIVATGRAISGADRVPELTLCFLPLSLMFAGMLLSRRATTLLGVIQAGCVAVVPAFNATAFPNAEAYLNTLVINMIACVLASLSIWHREGNEHERRRALIESERKNQQLNVELEQRVDRRTAELAHANAELAASNRALESFSSAISHDLRAPVRAIQGFASILADDIGAQLDDEARAHLDRIITSSERMGQQVDGLLRLSRLSREPLRRSRVNLSAEARRILADLARDEPDREVAIEIEDGLVAEADPHLVGTLLDNLLANAWKFTRKQPLAAIAVRRGPEDSFAVRDNGAGFDMAYVDKLFRPFVRLHTRDEFDGTGIGLVTVKRIVSRHGGRVWAESEPGRGATFYVTLVGVASPPRDPVSA